MLVSRPAAELFALLVDGQYGARPSRILAALLTQGRSTVPMLRKFTGLSTDDLQEDMINLSQWGLLYQYRPWDSQDIWYEANPVTCYNLVRTEKIAGVIADQYGPAEEDVARALLCHGQVRISNLERMVPNRADKAAASATAAAAAAAANVKAGPSANTSLSYVRSIYHLHRALYNLIQADLLEVVGRRTFQSPDDIYFDVDAEMGGAVAAARAGTRKADRERALAIKVRAAREERNDLKRQLDPGPNFAVKRIRLANGHAAESRNGREESEPGDNDSAEERPFLDSNATIFLNPDRCLVLLRNRTISRLAADAYGDVTGQVYHALLRLVTAKTPRCGATDEMGTDPAKQARATTMEVLRELEPWVDVSAGIGVVDKGDIDVDSAERVRTMPPGPRDGSDDDDDDDDDENDDGSGDDENDQEPEPDKEPDDDAEPGNESTKGVKDDSGDDKVNSDIDRGPPHTNGSGRMNGSGKTNGVGHHKATKAVGDADEHEEADTNSATNGNRKGRGSADDRAKHVRQHLLMLAESRHRFVRLCGRQGRGQWTVDFSFLMEGLREFEMDATIEQRFGRHGLRLTRILRRHGRVDERVLPGAALMKKLDLQERMMAMLAASVVDVQEVPRDSSRTANRTMFLWFFDGDRYRAQILERCYGTMYRCLQRLRSERSREQELVAFVARPDVKGREEEVMGEEYYGRWLKHQAVVKRLLAQVRRSDEVVGMLRDY